MQSSLRAALGVPVVVAGVQSVPSSDACVGHHWLDLLEAPSNSRRPVRLPPPTRLCPPLSGMTAEELALADEKTWEELHSRLHN